MRVFSYLMFISFICLVMSIAFIFFFFFFNDTATTEIYTLSLHDALPIYPRRALFANHASVHGNGGRQEGLPTEDRKSTRLNSSHSQISYAVFCLKKKKKKIKNDNEQLHKIDVLAIIYHDMQVTW